jgi:hypothetical protein
MMNPEVCCHFLVCLSGVDDDDIIISLFFFSGVVSGVSGVVDDDELRDLSSFLVFSQV